MKDGYGLIMDISPLRSVQGSLPLSLRTVSTRRLSQWPWPPQEAPKLWFMNRTASACKKKPNLILSPTRKTTRSPAANTAGLDEVINSNATSLQDCKTINPSLSRWGPLCSSHVDGNAIRTWWSFPAAAAHFARKLWQPSVMQACYGNLLHWHAKSVCPAQAIPRRSWKTLTKVLSAPSVARPASPRPERVA